MSKQGKREAGARAGLRGPKGTAGRPGKGVRGGREPKRTGVSALLSKGRKAGKVTEVSKAKAKDLQAGVAAAPRKPLRKKVITGAPDGSAALENGHWERFCQLMSEGRYSQKSCYAQCYPETGEEAARRSASDLMTKPDVRARINWLKAEASKNWSAEKEEIARQLYYAFTTPVGYVDEESPLAQEVTWDEVHTGGAHGQLMRGQEEFGNEVESPPTTIIKRKVKMMGKVESAKLLCQMMGWEKPKEVNLNVGYEMPDKALERAREKGIDTVKILKEAGLL